VRSGQRHGGRSAEPAVHASRRGPDPAVASVRAAPCTPRRARRQRLARCSPCRARYHRRNAHRAPSSWPWPIVDVVDREGHLPTAFSLTSSVATGPGAPPRSLSRSDTETSDSMTFQLAERRGRRRDVGMPLVGRDGHASRLRLHRRCRGRPDFRRRPARRWRWRWRWRWSSWKQPARCLRQRKSHQDARGHDGRRRQAVRGVVRCRAAGGVLLRGSCRRQDAMLAGVRLRRLVLEPHLHDTRDGGNLVFRDAASVRDRRGRKASRGNK
jgi:hypothetical protein